MGKINREELFKILDAQYDQCKSLIANNIDFGIEKLEEYRGDVIDIKTEINMGNTLNEGSLFRSVDENYYDKQKLLSSVPEVSENKISLDQLFWLHEYKPGYRTTTITAPKHKKKYIIKLNDNITQEQGEKIAQEITEQQFICYNKNTIKEIITLDVE